MIEPGYSLALYNFKISSSTNWSCLFQKLRMTRHVIIESRQQMMTTEKIMRK